MIRSVQHFVWSQPPHSGREVCGRGLTSRGGTHTAHRGWHGVWGPQACKASTLKPTRGVRLVSTSHAGVRAAHWGTC